MFVVTAPRRNYVAGVAQGVKKLFIQALVPKPSIKRLHQAILHRFARCDVMPFDLALLLPFKNGVRGQLGTVVRVHHARVAAALCYDVQLTGDTDAGD